MNILKELFESTKVVESEIGPWNIKIMRNGLKCEHYIDDKLKYSEYFESDELQAVNAFEGIKAMTPLDVFERMMLKTPFTKGFIYSDWNIINNEGKGFIIKPRPIDNNIDIDKYKETVKQERYKTNESLREIEMIEFLQYIDEPVYE